MTPEEQRLWSLYSCVPRSVIEIARLNGKPISVDDFISRYRSTLDKLGDKFGLMSLSDALSICVDLGVCTNHTLIEGQASFRKYLDSFNGISRGVLLTTHLEWIDNKWAELNHCRTVTAIDKNGWTISDVRPDGEVLSGWFPDQYLVERNARFFHLYQ